MEHYNPKEAEPKWQKYWEEQEIYVFHPSSKPMFSIDTPPPTVSGKMHLGHAFSYTQQDIIARFHRMKGENVFFPFGTDDNGLPTERLVEKERNILAHRMPRQDFITICNEVIAQEKPKFIQSWKDIGMSADFTRSYSTINKPCQITSQASFIDLHQKGRIFQQESPSSYCVQCQTAIAQAEFESVEMTSHFNQIPFMSRSKELVIATTRPELLPACVALFYHPEDKRYTSLKGTFAKVPLFNHEVPILSDEAVDKEKGTGLMMACTFGDKEDIDKWFRYNLPLRVVLGKNGRMNELAGEYQGLKIKQARQKIIEKLKEQKLLLSQKDITHAVNVHERCKTEIEFLKTKQWYIKILDLKEPLLEMGNKIAWYPPHMKARYDHWVQNLNWDWCVSRQRPFGIPIPVWSCTRCGKHLLPELKELPVDPSAAQRKCSCGSMAQGEVDVLDTWATSSVTPEIASNWISKGEYDFPYYNQPFSLRPQAHDIIRTWLFYTIVKSYLHHGRAPWEKVMISGHAQDPHGRKMSKSLGNIVEPQEMLKKYSADALRFWAAGSNLGDDLPFQDKDVLTGQKFINKVWNAGKFCLLHLQDYDPHYKPKLELFDQWLLSKLQKMVQEATACFEQYEYAKAKAAMEQFFWHTFCDYYLEIVKDRLYNASRRGLEAKKSAQYTLAKAYVTILKLAAPIMPHVTEEIYQHYATEKSIHLAAWPQADSTLLNEKAELAAEVGVDIINVVRKYKSENKKSMKEILPKIILVGEEAGFEGMLKSIEPDLKAVLNVEAMLYKGPTHYESERFKVKVGF